MTLTIQAVMALAASCQSLVSPATIAKIAQVESSLNPAQIHENRDHSIDVGLMQINSRNFQWLGLTMADALDPCKSIRAGAEVLTAYSRYNTGSPTRGIANGYALTVQGTNLPKAIERSAETGPIYVRPSRGNRILVYNGE